MICLFIAASTWFFRMAYYVLSELVTLDSPPFLSRFVSCLHAGVLVALGILWKTGLVSPNWWTPLAQAVPVGYLLHDIHLICTESTLWEVSTAAHHIAFLLLAFLAPTLFPDQTAHAFLAELSVFPLNMGWMMLKTGADTRWPRFFMVNSVILLLTFLRFRVYTFTMFTLDVMALDTWSLLPMVACLAWLNWYWFVLLCRQFFRVLFKKKINV
jgi:hypothetical protein